MLDIQTSDPGQQCIGLAPSQNTNEYKSEKDQRKKERQEDANRAKKEARANDRQNRRMLYGALAGANVTVCSKKTWRQRQEGNPITARKKRTDHLRTQTFLD